MARFAVPLQKGHLPEGVTGSNLLLNIGPDASGQIPAKAVEVFEGIGKWFEQNGDSIYGTKAGGVSMGKKVVSTRKGDMLYIPLSGALLRRAHLRFSPSLFCNGNNQNNFQKQLSPTGTP